MTQKEALDILKMGHNAFITGAAGSGKTFLLNQYISYLREKDVVVGITASTGIAATHMGGITIHSWSGLGIRSALSDYDLEDLESRQYLFKRIQHAKVLIIDEISMLHHFRLDLVEAIVRSIKRNNDTFGGMQVVLCGDFFQLPPISRGDEEEAQFAYHSEAWKKLGLKICYLEEQHRQDDKDFIGVLNAIRDNEVTEEIRTLLKSRFDKKPTVRAEPTKLYTHNYNVDIENEKELSKLPGDSTEYRMAFRGGEHLVESLKKGCLAPEVLRLKVGARVMFVKNNFEDGYANGTLGVIDCCSQGLVRVRTAAGKYFDIEPVNWRIEEEGKVKAEIMQYPIRLAWAITVHKSQGMSLDAAEIDLSKSFEKGMGYVALSRVRSLGGLSLKGLNETALEVDDRVLQYDREMREISFKHAEELQSLSRINIERTHAEFLKIVAPSTPGQKKQKKPDTVMETKRLLSEGKTLSEIAKERKVKEGTIIDHLEKIKEKFPGFSMSPIRKSLSTKRFKDIMIALKKCGMQEGKYLLTPAKNMLKDSVSFDEIRIVRLFL
jgi:predicted ATPase